MTDALPFSRCTRRALLAGAGAAALLAPALAQNAQPGVEETRLLIEEGRYLPLLRYYRNFADGNASAEFLAAQLAAMTGDEAAAFDVPRTAPLAMPDLTGCKAADAIETIVQAARARRIVMLNEAHNISRCRAFAGALALRLAGEGFTVFAGETFDTAGPAALEGLNNGAAIAPSLGWYLADPVYAEAVRAMRRKAWRFAGYEARAAQLANAGTEDPIAVREDAEANNFIADILNRDPKARVFVLCGYDHIRKKGTAEGQMWFAARLKAKTGIDPLCIAQHLTVPPPDPAREDPALKAILDTFNPTAPVVLFDAHDAPVPLGLPKGEVDAEVVHPRLAPVDGRPGWLAAGRKKVRYALSVLPGPHDLIQAVPLGEAGTAAAVPADQYPLKIAAREAVFFLAEGRYQVRLETDDGRSVLGEITA